MKTPRKVKKIYFPVSDQDMPLIIGVVSADPDYKLSIKLNQALSISLKSVEPVIIQEDEGKSLSFSMFISSPRENEPVYKLISNRIGNSFLIKKLKNIDYLLIVENAGKFFQVGTLTATLKRTDSVSAVFTITPATVSKDKNIGLLF